MKTRSHPNRRGQEILAQMGQIPVMIQGKVSERRQGGRVTGLKLQRWRNGRNETRHIPADLVETVRQGTQGYDQFMALAAQYVAQREAEVWGTGVSGKKSTRAHRRVGTGVPPVCRYGSRHAAGQGTG